MTQWAQFVHCGTRARGDGGPCLRVHSRPVRGASCIVVCAAMLLLSASQGLGQMPAAKQRIFRPDGPGPYPAVLFVPGCDGFAPPMAPRLYERRAAEFRGRGYLVVFVDYLGRRGLTSCAAGSITHDDAARDVIVAATWLTTQPSVDRARIAAIGWSYGGRAVLVALAERGSGPLPFTRAAVFYPDCRALEPLKTAVPVLMLLGAEDDMTPPRLCQDVSRRSTPPGMVTTVAYPGARHAFDVPELPAKMRYGLATIGHHPQAAAAAWEELRRFLAPVK